MLACKFGCLCELEFSLFVANLLIYLIWRFIRTVYWGLSIIQEKYFNPLEFWLHLHWVFNWTYWRSIVFALLYVIYIIDVGLNPDLVGTVVFRSWIKLLIIFQLLSNIGWKFISLCQLLFCQIRHTLILPSSLYLSELYKLLIIRVNILLLNNFTSLCLLNGVFIS